MTALDAGLVGAALLFAVSGYRQGFVVGVLSFVGFLGGGVLGARLAPSVAESEALQRFPAALVGLAVVLLTASVGQVLATVLGAAVRNRLTWRPARAVDALGGAGVSVVSLLLVAWLVGTAVAGSPYPALASQVQRSQVLTTVDGAVPTEVRRFFSSFRRLLDQSGFPEVFEGISRPPVPEVDPPDAELARSAVVQRTRPSVLKITGVAESCRRRIEGTGFVYTSERVMTNAHVVAGVRDPVVEVGDERLPARVVLFDAGRDVAVLAVPGLDRPALRFAGPAATGTDALVVGYPQDGPFRADAARIAATQTARSPDIYQESTVSREIYALRGLVRPGNSGGPLLDTSGQVLGVIFAAAADDREVGYALTAQEVAAAATTGAAAAQRVDTRGCD
jgi:S1-C subfamily serine protease